MAPDLKRKVDETRRARLALEEGMKQQQNAQVGPSFSAVLHYTISFVFAARPGVRKTRVGRPAKAVTHPHSTMGRERCATAVCAPPLVPSLGLYGSSQSIRAKRSSEWPTQGAIAYMVMRSCYLGCDGFVHPQCYLENPQLLVRAVT